MLPAHMVTRLRRGRADAAAHHDMDARVQLADNAVDEQTYHNRRTSRNSAIDRRSAGMAANSLNDARRCKNHQRNADRMQGQITRQ